jgi:hypothetical protein
MEILLGPANYATFGATFASNYTGAASSAVTRKSVSTPDLTRCDRAGGEFR